MFDALLYDHQKKVGYQGNPNLYLDGVGIRIGQKNAANIEFGFGSEGIFKAGYSCMF